MSRRAALIRRCALPAPKTFEGYDRGAVCWPGGFGRDDLLSLSFLGASEDLVLVGDVGCDRTHMASALCAACCARGTGARSLAASSLAVDRVARHGRPLQFRGGSYRAGRALM